MRRMWGLGLWLYCVTAAAGTLDISGVRVWPAPDNTRVVFDVSAPAHYNLFTLNNPQRIVIDIQGARLTAPARQARHQGGIVKDMRWARRPGGVLRVVLDLSGGAKPKSFMLQPNAAYGRRLVIDLEQPGAAAAPAQSAPGAAGPRSVVIVIDAGHGGEDPGAHGPHGIKEKDVALAIARQLDAMVKKEPGMVPVMTRTGDYYLSLRERTRKARQVKADLFVSIHADAFRDRRVSGSSVYALSEHGASDEAARWLAQNENDSDLIGGVSLDDKDGLLASVLLDLSQTATIEASLDMGASVLKSLDRIGKLHKHKVQQAGFVVLKSPDIPSILVETAFISNPRDEARLRTAAYQHRMAAGILVGLKDYLYRHPPAGSLLATYTPRSYIVVHGDTLYDIAKRYGVTMATLRSINHLSSGARLLAGQSLEIPVTRMASQ